MVNDEHAARYRRRVVFLRRPCRTFHRFCLNFLTYSRLCFKKPTVFFTIIPLLFCCYPIAMEVEMFQMEMFQRWIKQIFLCGMFCFAACALAQVETVLPDTPSPASKNIVVSYFSGAELQAETRSQLHEIKKALNDMLNLPIPELQARRYADYQMTPNP
jgi:hypothetical protein